MTTPYVVGKTVDQFKNSTDTYFFALRRSEDGDLYLTKTKLNSPSGTVDLFPSEVPELFADYDIPGDDYFDGRKEDHTLEYTEEELKYEQWKWVDGIRSYYIDSDGYFVVSIGKDVPLSIVEDIEVPTGHTQSFTLVGQRYNVNLYEELIQLGWNGVSEVTVTITGNIKSNSPTVPALTVDRPFVNGLTIVNNGSISGCNGSIEFNPTTNRNLGVAIAIDFAVDSFVNNGSLEAGIFNGEYANVFRGYSNIDSYSGAGTWIGYDD